jgi:hypothetical protein
MSRILAIAKLTFWEGVRMRIVLVFLIVLVFVIMRMPFALRVEDTLASRLQSFLSYGLGALGLLLSLATVFFSCATLTTELKECSLHLVVTKPVTRLQILLGKWLGVNLLNILIVALCGAAIYGLAAFLKSRPEQFTRDRLNVRDVVWTARVAATPVAPLAEIDAAAAQYVQAGIRSGQIPPERELAARVERRSDLLRRWRVVDRGEYRVYKFAGLAPPERQDTVVQLRYKVIARPMPVDDMADVWWVFHDSQTGAQLHDPIPTRERSGQVHQFLVQAAPVIRNGEALLQVINPYDPERERTLLFEGHDSLQLLYRVGGFEANFVKALLIILLRLALLSAVGVFFSVFVSFPVACLCAATFYVVCIGQPFWLESIGANVETPLGSQDPYGVAGPWVRALLVPVMKVAFPDFTRYDGAQALVDGEYISPGLLGWCGLHTLIYGGLLLLLPGWLIFRRREVAEVIV